MKKLILFVLLIVGGIVWKYQHDQALAKLYNQRHQNIVKIKNKMFKENFAFDNAVVLGSRYWFSGICNQMRGATVFVVPKTATVNTTSVCHAIENRLLKNKLKTNQMRGCEKKEIQDKPFQPRYLIESWARYLGDIDNPDNVITLDKIPGDPKAKNCYRGLPCVIRHSMKSAEIYISDINAPRNVFELKEFSPLKKVSKIENSILVSVRYSIELDSIAKKKDFDQTIIYGKPAYCMNDRHIVEVETPYLPIFLK